MAVCIVAMGFGTGQYSVGRCAGGHRGGNYSFLEESGEAGSDSGTNAGQNVGRLEQIENRSTCETQDVDGYSTTGRFHSISICKYTSQCIINTVENIVPDNAVISIDYTNTESNSKLRILFRTKL